MKELTISRTHAWLMGPDPVATGQQLRVMRRAHHLTQEQLSELFEEGGSSVSRNAISAWESGKRTPSLEHIVFLAELYVCPLDELVISFRRARQRCGEERVTDSSSFFGYFSEIPCAICASTNCFTHAMCLCPT